jgi:hypothetical protein
MACEASSGVKKKNGPVPDAAICFVFMNRGACAVTARGVKGHRWVSVRRGLRRKFCLDLNRPDVIHSSKPVMHEVAYENPF